MNTLKRLVKTTQKLKRYDERKEVLRNNKMKVALKKTNEKKEKEARDAAKKNRSFQ